MYVIASEISKNKQKVTITLFLMGIYTEYAKPIKPFIMGRLPSAIKRVKVSRFIKAAIVIKVFFPTSFSSFTI